ncbi:MAG TPA: OmpH family outer membrane protein [Acidobacteriaceae bacterium]|nr:OmpH family outer membrane protein [Acidobacteriaceae bacterium]
MNFKLVLVAAIAAGTLTVAAQAQTPAAAPAPQAVPAKIAFIELQEVAANTNEGLNAVAAVQKKFEPTKTKLEGERAEIESLTKQLQAAPATMAEEEKASRSRAIETKQKQYQLEAEDAQTSYGSDVQTAISKVIAKLGPLVVKYVQTNGYTVLLDNAGQPQQGGLNLLWGGTDISQAVVDAYNVAYPAAAPVPSAPTAARPRTPGARPATK